LVHGSDGAARSPDGPPAGGQTGFPGGVGRPKLGLGLLDQAGEFGPLGPGVGKVSTQLAARRRAISP
jgi:hypothetical protein